MADDPFEIRPWRPRDAPALTRNEDSLNFSFSPARVRETRDGTRFRIGRLTAIRSGDENDVTHLVDRTYDYASPRELRWHLAERFNLPPHVVTLHRH